MKFWISILSSKPAEIFFNIDYLNLSFSIYCIAPHFCVEETMKV